MWGWIIGGIFVVTFLPAAVQVGFDQFIKPKLRGASQESAIDRIFRKFKGKGFARANDVMLRSGDKTNQIDNLLITRYGIFVIESKNYSGIIQGRERSPRWLQIFPGGKYKPREFFNPIWQNEGHIRALKQLLGRQYPKIPYHNLVVFSDNCKCPRVPGVVTVAEMKNSIKAAMVGPPVLSDEDVATLKDIIDKNNIKDYKSRAEHLDHVKASVSRAKDRERQAILRERAEKTKADAQKVQALLLSGPENDGFEFNAARAPGNQKPGIDAHIARAKATQKSSMSEKMPVKESNFVR